MQIPEFWAEARQEGAVGDRQRVLRRFGWSDQSQQQAEQHAQHRVDEAFAQLRAGRTVSQRERKRAYGELGLPIREEVVARNGNDVITRNSYGARCLNEPDVLFADIDVAPRMGALAEKAFHTVGCQLPLLAIVFGVVLLVRGQLSLAVLCTAIAVLVATASLLGRSTQRAKPNTVAASHQRMRDRLHEIAKKHPGCRFAVYDTPAGLRLLALHQTFDPTSEAVQSLFRDLQTDPAYAQMCALQNCFRARLTAKPWRIGLSRPPTKSWPHSDWARAPQAEWVAHYEERTRDFAACRYLEDVGDGTIDPRCETVQRMHDELCQARTDLPLA
ncbi:MAG: hypothetical protein AB8H80_10580 [Planctomycetota bacterium]